MSEHHHHNKPKHRKAEPAEPNEGEGSRTAGRAYNSDLEAFVASNLVEPAAHEAKQFVEQHPEAADEAERKAKDGPHPIRHRFEELAHEGRALFDRAVKRVRAKLGR